MEKDFLVFLDAGHGGNDPGRPTKNGYKEKNEIDQYSDGEDDDDGSDHASNQDYDDEFDNDDPHIIPEGPDQFILRGRTPLEGVCEKFDLESPDAEIDTFAGLLTHHAQRILTIGDRIDLGEWTAEVLEVRDDRARRIRMSKKSTRQSDGESPSDTQNQPPPA